VILITGVFMAEVKIINSPNSEDIVLPGGMTKLEAFQCFQRECGEGDSKIRVHEIVESFPFDGARAFGLAIKKMFGWGQAVSTQTMFGENPPRMLSIEVSPGVFEEVIWGELIIPGIEGTLQTGFTHRNDRLVFEIGGVIKQKYKEKIIELARLTREIVKESSIYKGKAIHLKTDDYGDIDFEEPPTFIKSDEIKTEELIFSRSIEEQIKTNLFTPIEKTDLCRQYKIPLKRGILLSGPYGTGKTLTAYVAAKKCVENSWTFIYLDRVEGLQNALRFAKEYSPAVIFAEDIDQVTRGARGEEMNDILNTIDGVDLKNAEVITILTTNFVEDIDKAMIRPGRLDAVIPILPPDAEAVERLVRFYSRDLISESEDIQPACELLAGRIPAVIREVIERSKLYGLQRTDIDSNNLIITSDDLIRAAEGMQNHFSLMSDKNKSDRPTVEDLFKDLLDKSVEKLLDKKFATALSKIDKMHREIC